jgi:hypothetical protein
MSYDSDQRQKMVKKVAKIAQFFSAGLRPAPRRAAALDPSWNTPSPPRGKTMDPLARTE